MGGDVSSGVTVTPVREDFPMLESGALPSAGSTADPVPDVSPSVVIPPPRRPNLTGDLDSVLEFLPSFRGALHGYDRWQVDSYVSWAERELRAARRSVDEMAARFASCAAELERAREEAGRSEAGREARQLSERVGRILELAAEEAADLRAAGAAEGEGLVADAREYAAAMLRHARDVQAAAAGEREQAAAIGVEAADLLAATRVEAADLLAAARVEGDEVRAATVREQERLTAAAAVVRERLDLEAAARRADAEGKARRQREQAAAAAAEGIAAAHREIEELHCQRDRAAASLRQLTERIGEALRALAAGLPFELPNVVAPQPREPTPDGRPRRRPAGGQDAGGSPDHAARSSAVTPSTVTGRGLA
jgi:colicin import membrane protein